MLSASATVEKPPLLCLGHSHLRCVEVAAAATGIAIESINFWDDNRRVLNAPDSPTLIPDLQQRIADHPRALFSFMGGGGHNAIGLLSHPRRFDFVLPESPALPVDPRAESLPVDAVRAALTAKAQPFLRLLGHVRSLTRQRLVHVESPPPCRDEQRILASIPWPLFPGMRKEVAPRQLRYKLWRLHSEVFADFCALHDVVFARHPSEAVDEEGFLRPEFVQDGIHANGDYGALLLRQMQELA